jgi:hypothetical protein
VAPDPLQQRHRGPPGSLERVFLRDLVAARVYFMREGRLFLNLRDDTGTMEFGR